MQTLDEKITEIGERGIFSVGIDGSFRREFVPFNEELTAEMFAEEINSGRLSVKDAYDNFWSYEIEEFWQVRGRVLLPDWKSILVSLSRLLKDSAAEELFEIVRKTTADVRTGVEFNPFREDYEFSYKLTKSDYMKNKIGKELVRELDRLSSNILGRKRPLIKYYNYHPRIDSALKRLRAVGYYDKSLLGLLGTFKWDLKNLCPARDLISSLENPFYSAIHTTIIDILANRGIYHEKMDELLAKKDSRRPAMEALHILGHYEKLTQFLNSENRIEWEKAVNAKVKLGNEEEVMELIKGDVYENKYTRGSYAIGCLGRSSKFDILRKLLKSDNEQIRYQAAETLYQASEFEGLDKLVDDDCNLLQLVGLAALARQNKNHPLMNNFRYKTRRETDWAMNIYFLLKKTDRLKCFLNDIFDPLSADIAAKYLYELGELDALKQKTDNPWEDISMTAVYALEKDRDYIGLIELIKKDNPNTCHMAIESLIRINPNNCVEDIKENLHKLPFYAQNKLFVALQPSGYVAPNKQ